MIRNFKDKNPTIHDSVFIASNSTVIGDVKIGKDSSVFFNTVIRGDLEPIIIGERTNIQEHSLIHTSRKRNPTILGDDVTVGHRAIIHSGKIGNRVLIGMGAIILDDVIIEDDCIIAAGAVITPGKVIQSKSMVMGTPGKFVRNLTEEELRFLPISANNYVELGQYYRSNGF